MKISVLIPSRGRPSYLDAAISSIFDKALDPGNVEVVVKLDAGDDEYFKYQSMLDRPAIQDRRKNILVVLSKRGSGYKDNGRFYNECAAVSSGEYLIPFVDDAVILTNTWDQALIQACTGKEFFVGHGKVKDNFQDYAWSFPVIPRILYERFECLALDMHPSVDRCWEAFAKKLNCELIIPMEIYHEHLGVNPRNTDGTAEEGRVSWCAHLSGSIEERANIRGIAEKYAKII